MPARLRLTLIALTAAVVAGLGLVVVLGGPGGTEQAGAGFTGALRPPDIPPKDFALRDQDGRRASLRSHRGEVVVLSFMYTTCEDTCPIQADQVRGALDALGAAAPPALAISVDPRGDTPQRARAFLLEHRLTGRMRFLLGSRARLAPIWRAYGIQPQGEAFDHSAYVLLIDREGRQRIGFPVEQLTPERLAHDIRLLQAERG